MKKIFWVLSLITIALNPRLFLGSFASLPIEYSAIFLYASDIAIIGFLLSSLLSGHISFRLGLLNRILMLGGAAAVMGSVIVAPNKIIALMATLRLVLAIAYILFGVRYIKKEGILRLTLIIVLAMSVIEAGIGILQYLYQHDLGLRVLGESHLSTQIAGVAKLDVAGFKFLRAYGTFLHPNVLAVFLALGLVAASYFYLRADKKLYLFNWRQSIGKNFDAFITSKYFYIRLVLILAMSFLVFGLALTFSRSGWLAASIGIGIFAARSIGRGVRPVLRLAAGLACMIVAVSIVLHPFLLNRINTQNYTTSLNERVMYNGIGLAVAINNPLTGVGIGNYVISQSTQAFRFLGLTQPWQWQPAHNLLIAIAAETGLIGLLSFLGLLAIVVIRLLRQQTEKSALALSLIAVLLTSAMFDHFFLTLEQGRLIFSLVLILAFA